MFLRMPGGCLVVQRGRRGIRLTRTRINSAVAGVMIVLADMVRGTIEGVRPLEEGEGMLGKRWDCSGSKDNAEGSNDTGPNSFPKQTSNPQQNQPNLGARNGPSNSAMHKDLRFGAFEPTSAPAKIGSRVASFESSLPRFLGKTPRTYNGSEQSKSTLKPLSLEEYLVGAKATSTTLPTVHASTGAGPAIAGMEEGTADGLGSPTCQP
ncbi:hypothetical protein D1007_02209 [Hordeum vulgare]|nr:hypothetical protein D1007_02209 [Hordeum vulgare]